LGSRLSRNVWGRQNFGCPMLAKDHSPYETSAWVLTRERVGWGLRERYRIAKELPPSLLTLVRKLDAVEGNLLLRKRRLAQFGTMRELLSLWSS
jgi:hypothetical protein